MQDLFLTPAIRPLRTAVVAAAVAGLAALTCAGAARADDKEPVKIGILHSLYGTMSLSETSLVDVLKMIIEDRNQRSGGVLGRRIVPVVADAASDDRLAARMARKLIEEDGVAAIFGCWTSSCRKAVLPVVEELNSILFYPLQYEGQESSRNVFYTGAAPNQQALPAVDYLANQLGVERWVLVGSDYVYPRTVNEILVSYLMNEKGVRQHDIAVHYEPLGATAWEDFVVELRYFTARGGGKTGVISTVNGDSNIYFYLALANAKIDSARTPVVALSIGEEEIAGIDTTPLVGHLAAASYFMSIDYPENRRFANVWQSYARNPRRVTKDPMEAHFISFSLWVQAVEAAGTTDTDAVIDAMIGLSVPNLTGTMATVLPNHHITKPAFVGEIQKDGQFKVVWHSREAIAAEAWSNYLPATKDIIADWRPPISCGRYNTVSGTCEDSRDEAQALQ